MRRFVQILICTIFIGVTWTAQISAADADTIGGIVSVSDSECNTRTQNDTEVATDTKETEAEPETEVEAETKQETEEETEAEEPVNTLVEKRVTVKPGTDDTAIQKLLDKNSEGKYKLTVVIPKGDYKLNKTLYVYPNTTILATEAKLVKQKTYGAMLEAKLIADDGGYDANYNITVDGGMWDSEPVRNGNQGTETFRFIHSNNITVKNATLCNIPEGGHLIVLAGVKNATITNCKFYGYGKDWTKAEALKEAIQLDIVHSSGIVPTKQEDEILNWDDLPCDNIRISNCEFFQFSRGIGSHTAVAGRFHTNIIIENNLFSSMSDSAIRLYNYKDTIVRKNKMNNATNGIMVYTYIETANGKSYFEPNNKIVGTLPKDYNIRIEDNVISNIKKKVNAQGEGIRIKGGEQRPLTGVVITGNTISLTEKYGIYASAAPRLVIAGKNRISTTQLDAIFVTQQSGYSTIYDNTITYTNGNGITIKSSDMVSVYSNWISNPAQSGVCISNSKNCVVGGANAGNGNVVTGSGKHGIWITKNSVHAKVYYNKITEYAKKSNAYGVYVLRSSGNVTNPVSIQNNTIRGTATGTGKDGIRVGESAYVTVSGNAITDAMGDGICVSRSKYCTIGESRTNNNKINNCTENGISIGKRSDGGRVQYNKISNSVRDGIRLSNSRNVKVLENQISAKINGISAVSKSKQALIQKNVIDGYGVTANSSGIYISQSGGNKKLNTRILENTVRESDKNNTNQGIHVSKSAFTLLQQNEVENVTGNGIYLYTSKKCILKENVLSDIAENGIYLYVSANCKIMENDVWTADRHGLYLYSSSKCKVTDNGITLAKVNGLYLYSSKECDVLDNAIYDSKEMGILATINSNDMNIEGNVISDANDTAIVVNQSNKAVIKENWITVEELEESDSRNGIYVCRSEGSKVYSNIFENVVYGEEVIVAETVNYLNYGNEIR